MSAVGGSIEEISVRGRVFAVAADADAARKLGGYENEVSPNGNATARLLKTRVAWAVTGLTVEIDDTKSDHEFLQDIIDGNKFVPITITYVSGVTYNGTGQVTGETDFSNASATASVDLMGEGILTPQ